MSITEQTGNTLLTLKPSIPKNLDIMPVKAIKSKLEDEKILDNIDVFKKDAIIWAKTQLATDMLEIKEVKDLVSIVDTIEKSVKPKEQDIPIQVNVLVQNLMDAKDDC